MPADVKCHHIGSTAISGIWAKPIIDILIVVGSSDEIAQSALLLQKRGYIAMFSSKNRVSLNKVCTVNDFADRGSHIYRLGKN